MNSVKFGSKVKGFTLIEMLVVITIIALLAGISSIAIYGFQRDARVETNNNKAQMIYTGIQNVLVQCEIHQDHSLLDADLKGGEVPTNYSDDPMLYAELYFRVDQGKIDDEIKILSKYKTKADAEGVAKRDSSDDTEEAWFKELEKSLLSVIDSSFEGVCAVYIDYEDFVVDSAICIEPAFAANVDITDLSTSGDSIGAFLQNLNAYIGYEPNGTDKKRFRIISSRADQKDCVKNEGVYFGAYPTALD